MRVDVSARKESDQYMIECSECGPVGVVQEALAIGEVKAHLLDVHGVTVTEYKQEP